MYAAAVFLLVAVACFTQVHGSEEDDMFDGPAMEAMRHQKKEPPAKAKRLARLEVLPGGGWDNLQNVDLGRVVEAKYTTNQTTEDGKYLIPDGVFVIPVKTSHVETFSELFNHWSDYSSTTAASINIGAKRGLSFGSISGSFSTSIQKVKKHQVGDKAMTSRVQLRYTLYQVRLQPDTPLHPVFKNRLLQIASYVQSGDKNRATFLSQLLVKDFGTHVLTHVDAGAVLSRVDHIKSSFKENFNGDSTQIKAAASASFLQTISVDVKTSTSFNSSTLDRYLGNRTASYIETFGGPPFRANFTVNDWEAGLDNNLVPIDRDGEPISFLVNANTLPELPSPTLLKLSDHVHDAIKQYYAHNLFQGCTDPSARNFNLLANDDDGSCNSQLSNFTFGGIYQTCRSEGSVRNDPCQGLLQKNPKTASFSCPIGYKPIKIHEGRTASDCHRSCYPSLLLFITCRVSCGWGQFETFWCAAEGNVEENSGFLFGGIYSQKLVNPLTKTHHCPEKYFPLKFGPQLHVCVSDDYELGYDDSVPFAGFFSCKAGNPLSLAISAKEAVLNASLETSDTKSASDKSKNTPKSINDFIFSQGPSHWPKKCPMGYSQHLAAVEANCEIQYCVKANVLSVQDIVPVIKPPYVKPADSSNITLPLAIINSDVGHVYYQEDQSVNWKRASKHEAKEILKGTYHYTSTENDGEVSHALKPGVAVVISICGTLILGAIILLVIRGLKRWRGKKRNDPLPVTCRNDSTSQGSSVAYVAIVDE